MPFCSFRGVCVNFYLKRSICSVISGETKRRRKMLRNPSVAPPLPPPATWGHVGFHQQPHSLNVCFLRNRVQMCVHAQPPPQGSEVLCGDVARPPLTSVPFVSRYMCNLSSRVLLVCLPYALHSLICSLSPHFLTL